MPSITEELLNTLKSKFISRLDSLIEEILQDVHNRDTFPSIVFNHIKEMINYNLQNGKMLRGLAVILTGKTLCPDWNDNIEDHFIVLGWCVEFLQSAFLIADDIMDEGQMRRNQLCWYRVNHIRMISIDDIFLLESQIYILIKKYFGPQSLYTIQNSTTTHNLQQFQFDKIEEYKKNAIIQYNNIENEQQQYLCYSQLINIFQEVHYITSIGQYIDTFISIERKYTQNPSDNYDVYSLKNYYDIVINKTSYYTFYLPISLAYIYICNLYPPTSSHYIYMNNDIVLMLCQKMGMLFQIQDDYLDFYSDPTQLGKIGKDIEEAKCSWLYVQLLLACNDEDRQYCIQNYGNNNINYSDTIKQLYCKYNLKDKYIKYQAEEYEFIMNIIEQYKTIIPYDLFYFLLHKINKRVY